MSDKPTVEGERASSAVAPKSRLFTRKQKATALIVGFVFLILGLLYAGGGKREPPAKDQPAQLKFANPQPLPPPSEPHPAPAPPPGPPIIHPTATPGPPPQMQPQTPPKLLVIDDQGGASEAGVSARQNAAYLQQQKQQQDGSDSLENALKPTVLEASSAAVMPHPELTVAAGRSIQCVMDTAIDSQLPGIARCHIPFDVTGEVGPSGESGIVLLERDTVVTGEIRSGSAVKQGQDRVFVLWTRARTPKGVVIPLASPATDAVGRSGIEGDVDNHWWTRFGNALLFTAIDATTQIASSALSPRGGTSINLNSAGQTAGEPFRQGSNIPPTITVHQGEVIGISVARDLDFSHIYRLKLR